MGCGGSKLDPEHEAVPARLRPILRRRLEEIRARRNGAAANGVGMSKKELLGDGSSPEGSFHHTQDCPPTLQKITASDQSSSCSSNSPSLHKQSSSNSEVVEKGTLVMEDKLGDDDDDDDEKEIKEGKDDNDNDKNKGLEEEESAALEDNFLYCPSSPSFRVYCVDSADRITNLADKEELDGLMEDNMVEDPRISTSDESTNSNEVSVKQPQKKAKKGTMFKKMMPKGGISKFYNFPCSSDNSHLLQKAAA